MGLESWRGGLAPPAGLLPIHRRHKSQHSLISQSYGVGRGRHLVCTGSSEQELGATETVANVHLAEAEPSLAAASNVISEFVSARRLSPLGWGRWPVF